MTSPRVNFCRLAAAAAAALALAQPALSAVPMKGPFHTGGANRSTVWIFDPPPLRVAARSVGFSRTMDVADLSTPAFRDPTVPGQPGGALPSSALRNIAGLSKSEVKAMKIRCQSILAASTEYEDNLVELCRLLNR